MSNQPMADAEIEAVVEELDRWRAQTVCIKAAACIRALKARAEEAERASGLADTVRMLTAAKGVIADIEKQLAAANARAETAEQRLLVEERQGIALRKELAETQGFDALQNKGPDADLSGRIWSFKVWAAASELVNAEHPSEELVAALRMEVEKSGASYICPAVEMNARAEEAERRGAEQLVALAQREAHRLAALARAEAAEAKLAEAERAKEVLAQEMLSQLILAEQRGDKLAACREAGFLDERGEVRRVHSTGRIDVPDSMFPPNLPVTADEVIVIPGGTHYVWFPGDTKGRRVWLSGDMRWFGVHGDYHTESKPIDKCYSTREAAEAARSKEGGQAPAPSSLSPSSPSR